MADNRSGVRSVIRLAALAACSVLLANLVGVAGAEPTTEQRLKAAEAEVKRLLSEIRAQQGELDRLSRQAAELAAKVEEAEARWEQITEQLRTTRAELQAAREEYARLRDRLDARAREAYMAGPGDELEFLLGATSLADLSDRVAFVDALAQTDADLANEVENLRNELADRAAQEARLQARAAEALREKQAEYAALEAKLAEQQRVLDELEEKKARAEELVKDLRKKWREELAALTGLKVNPDGIFQVCPVDQPRAVYDGFGAPRYAGGYHPHAGNDIIAPMGTPIRAPFPGTARASSNTLGGLAVYVYGANGYVYNAHLSAYSEKSNGPVQAGDIIGYVGETGDTDTPHNHFEWHPNVIPSDWPASPSRYSVIGSAVHPWPLLQAVC
ncbi:Chromosome partition protein Smc [bacterium HR12]|nr:Chromosome partition protein Smc [bacterium HR12]